MQGNVNIDVYMQPIKDAVEYAKSMGGVTAYNWNETLSEKNVVAFGVGKFLQDIHERLFKKVNIKYLCDNDSTKWGKYFYGKECISPQMLKQIENVYVVIVLGEPVEVEKQLRAMEIESMPITEMHFSAYEKGKDCKWLEDSLPTIEEALLCLDDDKSREIFTKIFLNKIYMTKFEERYDSFAEEGLYFENGFWDINKQECLVDGGAYVGDTIDEFISTTQGEFHKIYSFEYEETNYIELCKNITENYSDMKDKIELYSYGIWNRKEEGWCTHFGESDGTQLVEENCGQKCALDRLDSILENKRITILKLDIEGAEMQGLEGAINILKTQKPKLAICLYHKPEDLWEVPVYIKKINPNYRMVIKHHRTLNYTDTVLYAK